MSQKPILLKKDASSFDSMHDQVVLDNCHLSNVTPLKKFIVFEGVDGAGKSQVSTLVAERIGAIHLESPIGKFKDIRTYIDDNLDEKGRFFFYLASNFDLSNFVRQETLVKPVVCSRYFHSTIIGYASRQQVKIDDLYKNPLVSLTDLKKPDITFFLYVDEPTQIDRISAREPTCNSKTDYKCLNSSDYRKILHQNYYNVSLSEGWFFIDTTRMSINDIVNLCVDEIFKK
jgi:dTMP kinase